MAILAGLVAPADSRAAGVGLNGDELVFFAVNGETNRVTVALEDTTYRVTDTGVPQVQADTGCMPTGDPQTVICSGEGVAGISASVLDGDDQVTIDAQVAALVTGGPGRDIILGGAGSDRLSGADGGDTVSGRDGNDFILELDGDRNILDGGAGADQISGGLGPDEIFGGPGDDRRLFGAEGDDVIDGGEGDDLLDPGTGPEDNAPSDADRLIGGPGLDAVSYELRAVSVRVSIGDGPNDGVASEHDEVGADIEGLIGSQASDQLSGSPRADFVDGRGGGDQIEGLGGEDLLDGGDDDAASDTIRGGADRDALRGRAGGDRLEGGEGDDALFGEGDSDRLLGGSGIDTLDGGTGDDDLDGQTGADVLTGGGGIDTVRYPSGLSPVEVTIDGIANDGAVQVTSKGRTRVEEGAVSEGDNVGVTNERVAASRQDDTVSGNSDPNGLEGATGEDYLDGRGGADTLSGGASSDTLFARDRAVDRVSCGAGYDYVVADRRDVVPSRRSGCEYVDDGSRSRPASGRDVAVQPRCKGGRDAEISPPNTRRAIPLKQRVLLPVGSQVDALDCRIGLTVGVGRGRTRSGTLSGGTGEFRISQRRRRSGMVLTEMRSTDCAAPGAARKPVSNSRIPRLSYRRKYGRIAFPTNVRLDAAKLAKRRGVTTFSVNHQCGRSATIRVSSGRLTVIDLGRRRRVEILGPGDCYRARAPGSNETLGAECE